MIQIEDKEKVGTLIAWLSKIGGFIVSSVIFNFHNIVPAKSSLSLDDKLMLTENYKFEKNYSIIMLSEFYVLKAISLDPLALRQSLETRSSKLVTVQRMIRQSILNLALGVLYYYESIKNSLNKEDVELSKLKSK